MPTRIFQPEGRTWKRVAAKLLRVGAQTTKDIMSSKSYTPKNHLLGYGITPKNRLPRRCHKMLYP